MVQPFLHRTHKQFCVLLVVNMNNVNLHHGDCLDVLKTLPDNSVDSIVTDPPYGLSFMGKKWDYDIPSVEIWQECLRVLKPGGHLLAFAGTRTQHRMATRIEDAGFEIRDMLAYIYGSGMPKNLDVSKAIDKAAGAEREVVGDNPNKRPAHKKNARGFDKDMGKTDMAEMLITAPATPEAQKWDGFGTALKPALEPITLARKPLIGTVAENVLTHGTGALNIDACRVEADWDNDPSKRGFGHGFANNDIRQQFRDRASSYPGSEDATWKPEQGRWPANVIHDGSDEVLDQFPTMNGGGSPSRFFYCPKASKKDRDSGLVDTRNTHVTVKPTELMRYLCRLVTPPGGTTLDPFMGSGSTGRGAVLEGFGFIGIEREAEYIEISKARIQDAYDEVNASQQEPSPFF
jgi:DNA modification methylase